MMQPSVPQDFSSAVSSTAVGVVCPRCDRRSLDELFCEHCQFELPPATVEMATFSSPTRLMWSLASFGVHWPEDPTPSFDVEIGKVRFRVRGLRPALWAVHAPEVRNREATTLPSLPPVHHLEINGGALVLAEAWPPNAAGLGNSPSSNVEDLLSETLGWCRRVEAAMTELHSSGNIWLEFDPTAIEVSEGRLRITNLDWRLFPFGKCPTHLARISPSFSAPEICRFHDEYIGPRTDVFHLALAAYYRLAGLGNDGFSGRGLESFGFDFPSLRIFRSDLPAGVWPVLRSALSINPGQRPATVREFIDQLGQACQKRTGPAVPASERASPVPASLFQRAFGLKKSETLVTQNPVLKQPVIVDIGSTTIAGRAKSASGGINQDSVVVLQEPVHDRSITLMIVADGVTHARVGAGEQASRLACKILVDSIHEQIASCPTGTQPYWPEVLDRACQAASQAIVAEALAVPDRPALIRDNDMMSTTALIGILDAHELYLANVGDSRAYLVINGVAEQLTIDGDVASSQLMNGVPPEQVQELGSAGKALRFCLGACRETQDGQIVAEMERARPMISQWTLEPNRTFVFCSDGLVEERVFLEPEDLVRIIDANPDHSSQSLAELMVAAADARQRLPSEAEPNGYGDNITCIVLRVTNGSTPHETSSRKG